MTQPCAPRGRPSLVFPSLARHAAILQYGQDGQDGKAAKQDQVAGVQSLGPVTSGLSGLAASWLAWWVAAGVAACGKWREVVALRHGGMAACSDKEHQIRQS